MELASGLAVLHPFADIRDICGQWPLFQSKGSCFVKDKLKDDYGVRGINVTKVTHSSISNLSAEADGKSV